MFLGEIIVLQYKHFSTFADRTHCFSHKAMKAYELDGNIWDISKSYGLGKQNKTKKTPSLHVQKTDCESGSLWH